MLIGHEISNSRSTKLKIVKINLLAEPEPFLQVQKFNSLQILGLSITYLVANQQIFSIQLNVQQVNRINDIPNFKLGVLKHLKKIL